MIRPVKKMPTVVLTIGHSTRDLETFFVSCRPKA